MFLKRPLHLQDLGRYQAKPTAYPTNQKTQYSSPPYFDPKTKPKDQHNNKEVTFHFKSLSLFSFFNLFVFSLSGSHPHGSLHSAVGFAFERLPSSPAAAEVLHGSAQLEDYAEAPWRAESGFPLPEKWLMR